MTTRGTRRPGGGLRVGLALLAFLLAAPLAQAQYGGAGSFVKITSRADVADGYYVVANSDGTIAMSGTNPGAYFERSTVSPVNDTLTDPPAVNVWLLQTNSNYGGFTIFNETSNKYVSFAGTANAAYAAGAVNGTTGVWSFAWRSDLGCFAVSNVARPYRYLQYNTGSPRFSCYSNNASMQNLTLYKMLAATPTAPVFTSGSGPFNATALSATNFVVTASGQPAPTLALQGQTASGGFSFTAATGVLNYTPPVADIGTQTFTFTASNEVGVATQTMTVVVSAAPVYVPEVSVTNVATNGFTVQWTACTGATGYQVQVATDMNFTQASSGETTNVLTNAAGSASPPTGWTYNISSKSSSYLILLADTHEVRSPIFSTEGLTALSVDFLARTYGGVQSGVNDVEVFISTDGGTNWVSLGTVRPTDSNLRQYSVAASAYVGYAQVCLRWTTPNATGAVGAGIKALNVTGSETGAFGSLVVDVTTSALATNITGLALDTAYYVRVRRLPVEEWSAVVPVTTAGAVPTAPWFTSSAGPYSVAAGDMVDFIVSALGVPTPVLALSAATAPGIDYEFDPNDGYFVYQPPLAASGSTQVFTFTASNTQGVATQTVTVNVATVTAPAFGANPGPLVATVGVACVFTVSATGLPPPALALQSQTAGSGYNFTPATGELSYTPPAGDIGSRSFTFTAGNVAGTATQVVQVTVHALPTIDPLPTISIAAGQTTNVWIVAREAEGDSMTLAASNLPANAAFSTVSGTSVISNLFTFAPDSNQMGQAYTVAFTASDPHGSVIQTLSITVASADPWADYYASCYENGVLKTGNALKSALHDIISPHTSYSYDAAITILSEIDECPTNNTMVQLLYLQHGRAKSSFGGSNGQWNREHVWANSHGVNDKLPAYSDVHHLHPTDVQVNSTRGNKDFDTVSGSVSNYSYNSTSFEPPNAAKGDVARALFYMAVRYDGTGGVSDLELVDSVGTSGAKHGKLSTLLNWNELDPVNDYEIRRNNLVYSNWQGNRNPFVDHPEWARVVFDPNYVPLASLTSFAATPNGSSQIDLSFAYTGSGDGVVIVWNETGSFSAPSGTAPAVGQSFAGGTLLYKGAVSPQSHTGRTACQKVYYKCWTYTGTNYSAVGLTADATTAGPAAPASAWASATNTTDFTAAWSAVSGISQYLVDVVTGTTFGGAGSVWVPGYSNRAVSSATSLSVTGLTAGATYYFRVAPVPNCDTRFSPTGTVTTLGETLTPFQQWLQNTRGQNINDPHFSPEADYDGDGMTTWEEYLADTDPASAASVLALNGWFSVSDHRIRFSFPASTGRFYRLEYCTNLTNTTGVAYSNLGWGTPGMVITNPGTSNAWFWILRASPNAP